MSGLRFERVRIRSGKIVRSLKTTGKLDSELLQTDDDAKKWAIVGEVTRFNNTFLKIAEANKGRHSSKVRR